MAKTFWYIIEHGDHSDARILQRIDSRAEHLRAYKALLHERERAGCRVELVSNLVHLCAKPLKDGRFDEDATVLRLVTGLEWETEWKPFQEMSA